MNANENSPQKIYVAPDGSRIQGGLNQGSGLYQARPTAPHTYRSGSPAGSPGYSSGGGFAPAPSPTVMSNQPQISVGLLAWGVILVIFGILMVFAPIFGAGTMQALIVITFAAAGIAFLVLAYVTSRNARPLKAPTTD